MSTRKVLITGGSSFTGTWLIKSLAAAGHDVTAVFTRESMSDYADLRGRRVRELQQFCRPEFGCAFGDDKFLELIKTVQPDVLCHHGADVTNYRSPDFDFHRAVANNTQQIEAVLQTLAEAGSNRIVLTGTVFEGGEGAGSENLPHFSRYGLSKSLTAQVFQHFCQQDKLSLGKFVIPNPFGPLEEPRFTAYLIRTWRAGETPCVNTPAYIRDNLHVSLLAKHYAAFVSELPGDAGFMKTNPSGYVESQGAFAQRFAREMQSRLDIDCPVDLAIQTEFSEPRIRINTDALDEVALDWDELAAWDEIGEYYGMQEVASR
ncbi:MAG: NAD(P)-dependent oxidoreductase [Planctomycetota bacterium]